MKRPFRHFRLKSLTFVSPPADFSRGLLPQSDVPRSWLLGIMIGMECGDALPTAQTPERRSALSHRRLSLVEEAPRPSRFPRSVRALQTPRFFYSRARVCGESLPRRWRLYYIKSSEWTGVSQDRCRLQNREPTPTQNILLSFSGHLKIAEIIDRLLYVPYGYTLKQCFATVGSLRIHVFFLLHHEVTNHNFSRPLSIASSK